LPFYIFRREKDESTIEGIIAGFVEATYWCLLLILILLLLGIFNQFTFCVTYFLFIFIKYLFRDKSIDLKLKIKKLLFIYKQKDFVIIVGLMIIGALALYYLFYDSFNYLALVDDDAYRHLAWIRFIQNNWFMDYFYLKGMIIIISSIYKFYELFSFDSSLKGLYLFYRLAGPLFSFIGIFVVYLISNELTKKKYLGLFASMFWALFSLYEFNLLNRGINTLSQEFGGLFFLLTLYFMIKYIKNKDRLYYLTLISLNLGIVFMIHPTPAMCSLIIVVAGLLFAIKTFKKEDYYHLGLCLVLLSLPVVIYLIAASFAGKFIDFFRIGSFNELWQNIVMGAPLFKQGRYTYLSHDKIIPLTIMTKIFICSGIFYLIKSFFTKVKEKKHLIWFLLINSTIIFLLFQSGRVNMDYIVAIRLKKFLAVYILIFMVLLCDDILSIIEIMMKKCIYVSKLWIRLMKNKKILVFVLFIIFTSILVTTNIPRESDGRIYLDDTVNNMIDIWEKYHKEDTQIYFIYTGKYKEARLIFQPEIEQGHVTTLFNLGSLRDPIENINTSRAQFYEFSNDYVFIFIEKTINEALFNNIGSGDLIPHYTLLNHKLINWSREYNETHKNMETYFENERIIVYFINNSNNKKDNIGLEESTYAQNNNEEHIQSTEVIVSLDSESSNKIITINIESPELKDNEVFVSTSNNGNKWSTQNKIIFDQNGDMEINIIDPVLNFGNNTFWINISYDNRSFINKVNVILDLVPIYIKPSSSTLGLNEQIFFILALENQGNINIKPNTILSSIYTVTYFPEYKQDEQIILKDYSLIEEEIPINKISYIQSPNNTINQTGEFVLSSSVVIDNGRYTKEGSVFTIVKIKEEEGTKDIQLFSKMIMGMFFFILEIPFIEIIAKILMIIASVFVFISYLYIVQE